MAIGRVDSRYGMSKGQRSMAKGLKGRAIAEAKAWSRAGQGQGRAGRAVRDDVKSKAGLKTLRHKTKGMLNCGTGRRGGGDRRQDGGEHMALR